MTERQHTTATKAVQLDCGEGVVLETLSLGEMIRIFRLKEGLTQDQLAEKMGVRKSSVSDMERGACLPKGQTIINLISSLGMESDGVEVSLLTHQYQIEQERRKQNPAILEQHLRSHSNGPVNYTTIARELGLSRRTVGKKHRTLQAQDPNVPPNIRDRRLYEDMTIRVRVLHRAGWKSAQKIAKQLHTFEAYVNRILRELREKGEIPRLRRERRTKEEIAEDDLRIKELHNQGLTMKQIAQELDKPFSLVCDTVNRLRRKNEVGRRMAKRKPKTTQVFP